MFNVNYILIKKIKHFLPCLYLRGIRYTFLCVLKSVIITVECLIWLLVMYFVPPPNIWFNYQSTIGKIGHLRFDYENP